jgi:hypothetical protein
MRKGRAGAGMETGIGAASDFYRLRVIRLTEAEMPEFEWREDILWREPATAGPVSEYVRHRVEALALDDAENVTVLGVFDATQDAAEAFDSAAEDLRTLTRSEFEDRYFPAR